MGWRASREWAWAEKWGVGAVVRSVRSGRLRAEWTTSLVFMIPAVAMSSRIGARAVPHDLQQNDPKPKQCRTQNAEISNHYS